MEQTSQDLEEQKPEPQYALSEIRRFRRKLIREIPPRGFFDYLIKDYFNFRNLQNRYPIFRFRWLIIPALMPSRIADFQLHFIKNIYNPAHSALDKILSMGWSIMGKKEYNLTRILQEGAKSFAKAELRKEHGNAEILLDKLREAETNFLVFIKVPNAVKSIQTSLKSHENTLNLSIKDIRAMHNLIQAFCDTPSNQLSCANIFLTLTILKSRRILQATDLLYVSSEPCVSLTEFDLDEDNKKRYGNYVDDVLRNIKRMLENRDDIVRVQSYIPSHSNLPDLQTLLPEFYNHGNTGESNFMNKDMNNIPSFAVNFIKKFLDIFKDILIGKINLHDEDEIQLFRPSLFQNFMTRIQFLLDRLDKMILERPAIPRQRYLQLQASSYAQEKDHEKELMKVLRELLTLLFNLGQRLAEVCTLAKPQDPNANQHESISGDHLRHGIVPIRGYNSLFDEEGFFRNTSLIDVLRRGVSLIYLFCLELRENEIRAILNRDQKTRNNIAEYRSILKRLLSKSDFASTVRGLKLDP